MLCHNYIFFDNDPSINALSADDLRKHRVQFAHILEKKSSAGVNVSAYSTLGLKAGTRFMLHFEAEKIETIQDLLNELMHTPLGLHLKISQTFFGMIRRSQYARKPNLENPVAESEMVAANAAANALSNVSPNASSDTSSNASSGGTKKYLVVYPFTKTESWHVLGFDERREMMKEHIMVGKKFTSIDQLLLYAYGVDDHEFIVSYETDSLLDFQTLVMELRPTRGRVYTKNDMPVFTCIRKTLAEALEMI